MSHLSNSGRKSGDLPKRKKLVSSAIFCGARARRTNRNGFTLVELLIVVAVMLAIAAIAVPNLISAVNRAKVARAVGDMNAIDNDIAFYESINNQLPDSLSQSGDGSVVDPWGRPYQYFNRSTMMGNGQARQDRFLVNLDSDYELYSLGPDGLSAPPIGDPTSQDDIIRGSNGGYLGPASLF